MIFPYILAFFGGTIEAGVKTVGFVLGGAIFLLGLVLVNAMSRRISETKEHIETMREAVSQ